MPELWYSAAPAYEPKSSKSIIHRFMVKGHTGLTINPYQGCQHRCAYCYATYEWSPEFYDKIYAKINAAQVLEKEMASWKHGEIDPVMISSATDPYQPAEIKYGLTRKCVQVLQKYNAPYYVFTKSAIIERDLKLHARYRHNCFIVWSITTCSEKIRLVVEPGTPPASRIFDVIRKFSDAGVCCGVNVDPIIPLVTDSDSELQSVVDCCKEAGVGNVFGAALRLRTDIWERMKMTFRILGLEDAIEQYKQIFRFEEPLNANYVSADSSYQDRILGRLKSMILERGMSFDFPKHICPKNIDKSCLGQTSLLSYVS
jgi:DNA repair photolyase